MLLNHVHTYTYENTREARQYMVQVIVLFLSEHMSQLSSYLILELGLKTMTW